jgi:hypothetical protein
MKNEEKDADASSLWLDDDDDDDDDIEKWSHKLLMTMAAAALPAHDDIVHGYCGRYLLGV